MDELRKAQLDILVKQVADLRLENETLREALENIRAWDIGLMNTYGGGNVAWWHDYIRSVLGDVQEVAAAALEDER